MDTYIPIKFPGGNLGDRHKFMNQRVRDAIKQNVPFEVMKQLQPQSAVDRLFMIDLASKCKNFDYLIENFKDRNMLFVARALKSTWLITDPRYADIINPKYLEHELFPQMMTTAVNKMLHRIYIHLKHEERCYEFYQHYKLMRKVRIAKYFLKNCSKHVILNEIQLFLDDIAPHYLKMICEKCPEVYKKYINVVINNEKAFQNFNSKKTKYFSVLKIILKIEPDIYFEILEQYYDNGRSSHRLSPKATRHIMARHRDRYLLKPELYGGALLHLPTLARCLNEEEAQDLLLRLARARYLEPWFTLTYKSAEPLLKRISKENRITLVKNIFQKNISGGVIHKSPYPLPVKIEVNNNETIFSDSANLIQKIAEQNFLRQLKRVKGLCGKKYKFRRITLLDRLFDKYRFTSFFQTFHEMKRLLQIESSHHNRLMILNVLVSKTLKRPENVEALLELFATKHANEPVTLRASVIRSLVRRAAVYRLADEPWQLLREIIKQIVFQSEEQVPCPEGLHAILLHDVLNNVDTAPEVIEEFNKQFDSLVEYDLTASEKRKVCNYLYQMLLERLQNCLQNNLYEDTSSLVYNLLHLLRCHKVDIRSHTEVLFIIKKIAQHDLISCKNILNDLYFAKLWRRSLTRENFILRQDDESYINALRHDVTLVNDTDAFERNVMSSKRWKFDKFLAKLKLYFEEISFEYLSILQTKVKRENEMSLKVGRGFCILQEPTAIWKAIRSMYLGRKGNNRRLAEILVSNVHLAWSLNSPKEKIQKGAGVTAYRNALSVLPADAVRAHLPALLDGPAPLVRLGVALALRALSPDDVVRVVRRVHRRSHNKIKRYVLSKLYRYFISFKNDDVPSSIWNELKTLMVEMTPNYNDKLWNLVNNVNPIVDELKMEYCMTIIRIAASENFNLCKLRRLDRSLIYIRDNLETAHKDDVLNILQYFLRNDFQSNNFTDLETDEDVCRDSLIRIKTTILVRFLLTCETERIQREALENVAKPFLSAVRTFWPNKLIQKYFECFLYGLKYSKAYLNKGDVNSTPVFETILSFMRSFLDVKQYFHLYSRVHLTLMYRETVKQLRERFPHVLAESCHKEEAAAAVGAGLAGYLAHELRHLRGRYFSTITDIYAREVHWYIRDYGFGSGNLFHRFAVSLVRGLIASEDDENMYMAAILYFYMGWHRTPHRNNPDIEKIWVVFENCKYAKVQCCLSVNLF